MNIAGFARVPALVLLFAAAGCTVLDNFRVVDSGRFYRSGQMEGPVLARTLKHYGIQTVVNLRGENSSESWYRDELEACNVAGVTHHDLRWSKNRLPEPDSLAQFVDIVETAKRPILVHCQGGIHRAGTASACYVLLSGGSVEDARKQFGLLFDDAYIGTLLDLYEGSDTDFATWCRTVYPGLYARVPASAPDKKATRE